MSDNSLSMEDRLEAVAKFAKLLERSDEEAMETIEKILKNFEKYRKMKS